MLMSWTRNFSPRRTADEMKSDSRMRSRTSDHWRRAPWNMNLKDSHEARAQQKSERGISRERSTVAYLRVPELTTPQKNMKSGGRKWATSLPAQRLSHETSIQRKSWNRLCWRAAPSETRSLSPSPVSGSTTRGTASRAARGTT